MVAGSEPLFALPENLLEPPPIDSLPSGFHDILQTPDIDTQLVNFVAEAKSTARMKAFAGYEGTTEAELQWSDACSRLITQHIEEMSTQHKVMGHNVDISPIMLIKESLCYGLSAYRMMMLRSIPPDLSACIDVGTRLKDVLTRTDILYHWRGHLKLLLWISFMGAHTVSQGPLRDWYKYLLNGINVHLGSKTWAGIKAILKTFLWIGRCEVFGTALWIEVELLANESRLTYPSRLASTAQGI